MRKGRTPVPSTCVQARWALLDGAGPSRVPKSARFETAQRKSVHPKTRIPKRGLSEKIAVKNDSESVPHAAWVPDAKRIFYLRKLVDLYRAHGCPRLPKIVLNARFFRQPPARFAGHPPAPRPPGLQTTRPQYRPRLARRAGYPSSRSSRSSISWRLWTPILR